MRAVDIIEKKKNGEALTEAEIRFLIEGYVQGAVPDYQMAAWAMAVRFQGMNHLETAALTMAMAESGDQADLSAFGAATVDKHSTGGVGDKTTLIVAPIVASLGGVVAKMSGRGLGHTGGTVDKLEAIPGYQTALSSGVFLHQVRQCGVAVVGQSGNFAPADKKLYALRDVTATVDSLPLIASSIMSKKLAAGAHSIVLDVKCGSGAFMKTPEAAAALAREMVEIGRACGRKMAALITNMDLPLGAAIGNALEVREAVEVLRGEGPADLRAVCLALAAEMLALCRGWSREEAAENAAAALESGRAFAKMKEWVAAQGGNIAVLDDPARLGEAPVQWELPAPEGGYIGHMDTEKIGTAAMLLGAGRAKKDDTIDPLAGIMLRCKTGDRVHAGAPLAVLHTADPARIETARDCFLHALTLQADPPAPQPLIYDRII